MSATQNSERNYFIQNRQEHETDNEASLELFTVGDAATVLECSTTTVRRVAEEMRLPVIRSVGGFRLFSVHQVNRIRSERERRAIEALP